MRTIVWSRRATSCLLGGALAVGLAGAFVGLGVNSFWLDELFTAWVVGRDHSFSAALARALTDIHPPLYYLSLFGFSELFGASEVVLRAFSAICATAAVAIFVLGANGFSLRARLFAGVIAVASTYWMAHSQEARSYSLGLLISAWMLVSALQTLRSQSARAPLASLAAAMLLGCFVHYYLFLVAEAVLVALFVLRPHLRIFTAAWGFLLLFVMVGYLRLVQAPDTLFLMTGSWIGSGPDWYGQQLALALSETLNKWTTPVVLICVLAFVIRLAQRRAIVDDAWVLVGAVPVLVVLGGVGASLIIEPNFIDRNILLSSPFLWALFAALYDEGVEKLDATVVWLGLAVAVLAFVTVGRIGWRLSPHNTPFRESARWIARVPDCAGKPIPVLVNNRMTMKPGAVEARARADYGYYLPGRAVEPVFIERLLAGAEAPKSGCSVLAWGAHYVAGMPQAERLSRRLSLAGEPVQIVVFNPGDPGGSRSAFVFVRAQASATQGRLTVVHYGR